METKTALPPFPPVGHIPLIGDFHCATISDMPSLRRIYSSSRSDELSAWPWPQAQKDAFLDQQFETQHCYYVAAYSDAHFLVIHRNGDPIGRLYIDMTSPLWHVIDIALLPEWRGMGIGSAIITEAQQQAAVSAARGIVLHVERQNIRAHALYRRLSFADAEDGPTHMRMTWLCQVRSAAAT